jgi:hypothetical protein
LENLEQAVWYADHLFNTLKRELIMAFTAALCKLQNVIATSSPLNGGLMEKISPRVTCLFGASALFQYLTASRSLAGLGGDA